MNSQPKKVTKSEMLELIPAEREKLESALKNFSDEQLVENGVIGDWSIKDILSHIVAWEQRFIKWAKIGMTGVEPDDFPTTWDEVHAMNAEAYAKDKKKSLAQVKEEFSRSYPEALETVKSIPAEMLDDPDNFQWRKTPFWVMAAANTFWHYKEHHEDLEKALESLS